MPQEFIPTEIEAKWQKRWAEKKVYEVDLKKTKNPFYNLVMFPYPSGDRLHVGHWYNFAPADSFGRYMRMKGYDVFEPMGFDAFGLPAENYAIKTGVHPNQSIKENVQTMITQLSRIGTMYDWSKTVNTSTPEYYKWTQWLFLQMFKNELAYKKVATVNWCPKDQTVLANEQVDDGKCERCGSDVIQKPLDQWFWKITNYAQKLLDGLESLNWPEKTKLMQQNWIGRSEGAEITFDLDGHDEKLVVFTTRPDTIFGATYMVLAPEHPLVDVITTEEKKKEIDAYKAAAAKKTELQRKDLEVDKSGAFTGGYALSPVSGKKIPVWIADYVLMNYGTGAIMAVPGHDERDHAFAKKYAIDIKEVVKGGENIEENAFTEEGEATNSDFLNGLKTSDAKKKMIEWLEKNKRGTGVVNYRLRDWLVSRQRYWGAPIPIVYDPEGNAHPVPEEHLPWTLPTDVEFKPSGESPLKASKEFKERTEKLFGKGWTPEYDTMDTFVCSSFYYLRYLMEGDPKTFVDSSLEKKWMPVNMYIGGPEHATMHLIYARFVMMALKDFGVVSHAEPFERLVHQGLITNQGAKMSKSKGNVVSPDSFIERHGSDVFRMYLMFMGPFTDGGDWSDTGIKGIDRFVTRVHRLFSEKMNKKSEQSSELTTGLHATVKKVTEHIEKLQFNTAISSLMELLNLMEKQEGIHPDVAKTFALLLAPLAPHLAEELWEMLGEKEFIVNASWPTYDESKLVMDTITIVVQINGKVRAELSVDANISNDDAIALAKGQENVQKYLEGKEPKKAIYVKGKLVSLVI